MLKAFFHGSFGVIQGESVSLFLFLYLHLMPFNEDKKQIDVMPLQEFSLKVDFICPLIIHICSPF